MNVIFVTKKKDISKIFYEKNYIFLCYIDIIVKCKNYLNVKAPTRYNLSKNHLMNVLYHTHPDNCTKCKNTGV